MIIWLSSYPKSGNTWVRLFLDNLLSPDKEFNINHNLIGKFPLRNHFLNLSDNINDQDEFAKNCIKAQQKLNLDNKLKIFKTHNAFWKAGPFAFTSEKNTTGVIHIVRDPRNVITSVLNHFSTENYDEAFKIMTNNKQSLGSRIDSKDTDLPTVVSSWSNHFNSWKKMKKNYLLIKYENLLNNSEENLTKLLSI